MSTGNNSQSLQKYAQPLFAAAAEKDSVAPYSYQDWYKAHQGIIPGQEFKQYNDYLVNWYKNRSKVITDPKLQLKLNYLALLKQLQLFFTYEEAENWYNQVDVNNEKELLLAIPYFSKKLKDISLYYLQLRKNIKEARLRYNQVGTNTTIVDQIQKLLLSNYTQKPSTAISIPFSTWKNVPELSSIQDSLTIEIEELYDKQHYFDQSPSVPVSAYYNLTDNDLHEFLTTKNLAITSVNWLYTLGIHPLSANYLETLSGVELSNTGPDLSDLPQRLAKKYLGQDKYISFTPTFSTVKDLYEIPINSGSNFFLWPGVLYRTQAQELPRYESINLQDTQSTTLGHGGSSLDSADTIYLKTTRGLEGAWLYRKNNVQLDVTMDATFDAATKTVFRYPFPGYGLSGEGIEWSGFDLKTNPQFFYLDNSIKKSIESEYWSRSIDASAAKPLYINDTTLTNNKAYASNLYQNADKIRVWKTPPPYNEVVYTGDAEEAWLYRMDKTDISIPANAYSLIFWPYDQINAADEFPENFPNDVSDACLSVHVSSVNFIYATAGEHISAADVIYKLNNYQDTIEDATECCWLSAKKVTYPQSRAVVVKQPSFQGWFKAGEYTQFLWQGRNNTDTDEVFRSTTHEPDCAYVLKKDATYDDHALCTCHQVLFTPFGHPGTNFTDYNGFADYIIDGNFANTNPDVSNLPLSAFCWYKTDSKQEWGSGRWITSNPEQDNKFYLETGKTYIYYRASNRYTEQNTENKFPDLITRYNYDTYLPSIYGRDFVWVRATKDTNSNWVTTNQRSKTEFYPGDFLVYKRYESQIHTLTGTDVVSNYIAENRGSIWSNYDYITQVENPADNSLSALSIKKTIAINYPYTTFFNVSALNERSFYKQYPAVDFSNILRIDRWIIQHYDRPNIGPGAQPTFTRVITGSQGLTFMPTETGAYVISVRAVSSLNPPEIRITASPNINNNVPGTIFYANTGFFTFTGIPPITCVPVRTFFPTQTAFATPAPGYVLNTPLRGWDYNLGKASPFILSRNNGAKPYWGKAYLYNSPITKNKGIEAWGTPRRLVDAHNIVIQPEMSDLLLETGSYIEYTRKFGTNLRWQQPLTLSVSSDEQVWCTLDFNTTAISTFDYLLDNVKTNLIVTPTLCTSNIVLRNFVDNEPVEVFYNAVSAFTWSVTASPEIPSTSVDAVSTQLAIQAAAPWTSFGNQHFPTVAVFPAFDNLYGQEDSGGFFTPSNLGATVYINKDFTTSLNLTSENLVKYFEDVNKTFNTRGLTQEDQPTPYQLVEDNNIWLKEPAVAGPIAGTIKKSVFKKYQKFLPYQSKYESNPRQSIGLITPSSRQTPWGGKDNLEWTDAGNQPVSPTGEINVDRWAESQVLKQSSLLLDSWVTDIFGNQYGLYKNLSGVGIVDRRNVPGEIWVRTNDQFVSPASKALTGVFDSYINTSYYAILTGANINKIDLFYDTLMVETTGAIVFEKLNYDFNEDRIFSLIDDARQISLIMPARGDFTREFAGINFEDVRVAKAGDTWFFPDRKKVVISVCGIEPYLDILQSTFYWELKRPTDTTTFTLTGQVTLPENSQSYIVSIAGVQQPSTGYIIDPALRTITFTQPVPANKNVYVLLPYNPNFADRYDLLPVQAITTSTTSRTEFPIPDIRNLNTSYSFNESQYIVTVGGVLQQPGTAGANTYTITPNNTINFNEPVPPNALVSVTRLPLYLPCKSSAFYTWRTETTTTINSLKLDGGPAYISFEKGAYIVNVGGVLQPPSKYQINSRTRVISFATPIPRGVLVSITQLSVPQTTILTPELYELDLNTQNLQKVFPVRTQDISAIQTQDFELLDINPPVLSYNNLTNEFLYTIFARNCDDNNTLIDIKITDYLTYDLKEITYYEPSAEARIEEPPAIVQPLYTKLTLTSNSIEILDFQCDVINGNGIFTPIRIPSWMELSQSGRFSGIPPYPGTSVNQTDVNLNLIPNTTTTVEPLQKYEATFRVVNSYGPAFYEMVVEVEYLGDAENIPTSERTGAFETSYNNIPVRGHYYIPPTNSGAIDVVLGFYGTIESDSRDMEAAASLLNILKDTIGIANKGIVTVTYPQENVLFGDGIVNAQAALQWLRFNARPILGINVNRIYLFGHSQGGYMVSRLNTIESTAGVISNAPGPIDLALRCQADESQPPGAPRSRDCQKLFDEYGSAFAVPEDYLARSLINFTTGTKAKMLLIQGQQDAAFQVARFDEYLQALSNCTDCAPISAIKIPDGGHFSVASTQQGRQAVLNFLEIDTPPTPGPVEEPSLVVTSNLIPFNSVEGSNSTPQTYIVAGSNLVSSVTANAPEGFQLSLNNANYTSSLRLPASNGNLNSTIYVRVPSNASIGTFSNFLTALTLKEARVPGVPPVFVEVLSPVIRITTPLEPILNVTGELILFGAVEGENSLAQSFIISGENLRAPVVVSAPSEFEISLTTSSYTSEEIILQPNTQRILPQTTIYIRLKNNLPIGTISGNITVTVQDLDPILIPVTGSVTAAPARLTVVANFTSFNTVAGIESVAQTFTVTGEDLQNPITVIPPQFYEISLDNINFTSASITFTTLNTTVYVRLGANATISGNYTGNITIISSPATPQNIGVTGTTRNILLDRSSWATRFFTDPNNPTPAQQIYRTGMNAAADRWETYLRINPEVVRLIRRPDISPNFNGISLADFEYRNEPPPPGQGTWIARCGVRAFVDILPGPTGVQFCALTFAMQINTYYETRLTAADWERVLMHEIGHGLGIGTFWQSFYQSRGAVPPVNNLLDGTASAYFNASQAYNELTSLNRTKIPLEATGGSGTASAHWEDSYRSAANSADGLEYFGIANELMIGFYAPNMILTKLSIRNMVDFGYQEINPGTSEGTPIIDTSAPGNNNLLFSMNNDTNSTNSIIGHCDHCSCGEHLPEPECLAKINLQTNEVIDINSEPPL